MADTRITRIEREIAALRNIGPDSNGQNKFILDELRPNDQNEASSSDDRIIVGRLQPKSNIYRQGSLQIHIILGLSFPLKPTRVVFLTKVYHPNVSEQLELCFDLLNPETSWRPTTSLTLMVQKIIEIMDTPDLYMVENIEAAIVYDRDRQEYERIATDTFNRNCSPRF